MPSQDDDLLKRLLATFKIEAQEHIQAIASGLVRLEKASTDESRAGTLDTTFRAAHSLKGAARTVNAADIESLCQSLESIFAALKRQEITPTPELFDLLHRVVDALGKLLTFLDGAAAVDQKPPVTELTRALQVTLADKRASPRGPVHQPAEIPAAPARTEPDEKRAAAETVRVATAKLDAVLIQAEELLSAKLAAAHHAAKLRHLRGQLVGWKKKWAKLRPDVRLLRQAPDGKTNENGGARWARITEFLDWNQSFVESLETDLGDLARLAERDRRAVGAMVDNLLGEMKKVVMQPFSTLLDVFPRFVRELSRDQGKEVALVISGADIEIDRRILEEMKDPLIHLVRNCLDHGIEPPAIRAQRSKPARGTLTMAVSARNGSNVELVMTDDGAGIDAAKVKAAAVKAGQLSPEQAEPLGDREALSLIFQSGVSTSSIITDISGRGLGLAIVKEKVDKLNGALTVETESGKGTTFRIVLPLTLARFRGVVVRVDEHLFVLPTVNVERVARIKKENIKTVENRETIELNGLTLALASLGQILALAPKPATNGETDVQPAIVLSSGGQRIAFSIDEVLGEEEVLVKPLGQQLARVRNIAGATVLGAGKVVPILSVPDLMKSAVRAGEAGVRARTVSARETEPERKAVLIAEDSITSRTLLKNILETAGYEVETAVDGIDAFTRLRSGRFDLVVSDVDMPRMNGFGLTTKVRADKKLAELPVVLVTALDSREDRERGIDAGANAYIVKSSFDQSNLLEVVKRLA